jgi:hypothetical protein
MDGRPVFAALPAHGDETGLPDHRARITVERCALEGGGDTFVTNHTSADATRHPVNCLYDKILAVTTAASRHVFSVSVPGTTVRSLLGYHPSVPMFTLGGFKGFANIGNSGIEVYNCTYANGPGPLWAGQTPIAATNIANAASESLDLQDAEMTTVGGTWVSRFWGVKHQNTSMRGTQETMDTRFASPSGFVKSGVPYVTSVLLNSSSGRLAWDDFYGTVRGYTATRGAVEGE